MKKRLNKKIEKVKQEQSFTRIQPNLMEVNPRLNMSVEQKRIEHNE